MVDSGYEAFMLNWVAGLRALELNEFVIVALDQPIWSLLREAGLQSHAVHFGVPSPIGKRQRAASWYDERYRQLMGSVPQRLLSLYDLGEFDLLLTDADVLWRRSPWPVLYDPRRAGCELLAIEGHGGGPPTPSAAVSLGAESEREAVLYAAHLNFALSAGEKVCLAKALGLWLLSAQHRHAFDAVPADVVTDAVRSLGRVAAVIEMPADEGRVVVPQPSRQRGVRD